jgi:hypothetical protein
MLLLLALSTTIILLSGGFSSRPWPFETILPSILLEQEKALVELRSRITEYDEKDG